MIKKSSLIILIIGLCFFACEQSAESKRKIKLADHETAFNPDNQISTTIYLTPKERRSIAVMFFQNLTGDDKFQWLQKGLTEMLIRTLSESPHITALSTERLFEIINRLKESESNASVDMNLAVEIAREANVEAVISGYISKSGDSLKIAVSLREPKQGLIIKQESVEGPGLESIFTMVDLLSKKIKEDLHLSISMDEALPGITDISTKSLDAWRNFSSGNENYSKLLFGDAINQYHQAIRNDSTFLTAYIPLANTYLHIGNRAEALKIYQKIKTRESKASENEKYQIELLDASLQEDFQAYIDIVEKQIQKNPDDTESMQNLADIFYGLQNYTKSREYSQKIIQINPNDKLAYNLLGYCHAHLGEFDEAVAALKKYQEIVPDEPNPFDSLGEIYLIQGDFENAAFSFRQAIEKNQNFNASWANLGNVALDQGDYEKALEYFQESLTRTPESINKAGQYAILGQTYWRLGKLDEALKNYQKAAEAGNYAYNIIRNLREIYLAKNDPENAQKILFQAYDQVKERLQSKKASMGDLNTLASLAFWNDLQLSEATKIVRFRETDKTNSLASLQSKFWLSLLLVKQNRLSEVDSIWHNSRPSEMMSVFKTAPQLSYESLWQYYFFINRLYYNFIQSGIRSNEIAIAFAFDNELKMPEMIFRFFLADLFLYSKEPKKAQEQFRLIGSPAEKMWMVIGPFENKNGFRQQFPPEREIALNKTYSENNQKIRWRHADDGQQDGFIDLRKNLSHEFWAVGYGLIYVSSPDSRQVQFRLGSNESVKVWLNDQEVWKFNSVREASLDADLVTVHLNRGLNKILAKVCNRVAYWGFYFRITDENGNGFPDLDFIAADKVKQPES